MGGGQKRLGSHTKRTEKGGENHVGRWKKKQTPQTIGGGNLGSRLAQVTSRQVSVQEEKKKGGLCIPEGGGRSTN